MRTVFFNDSSWKYKNFIILFFCITKISSDTSSEEEKTALNIKTTYQAEDANINLESHPQCKAWKLWKRTQDSNIDLSVADIDLLAIRKETATIKNEKDAKKYAIDTELLANYTKITIDFFEVCKLHARVLKIASKRMAEKHSLNIEDICKEHELKVDTAKQNNVTDVPDVVVWVNNTKTNDELKLKLPQKLFRLHQAIVLDKNGICGTGPASEDLSDVQYYEEKFGTFGFNVSALNVDIEQLTMDMRNSSLVDKIMRYFDTSEAKERPYPSTRILPFLKRVNYDSRSAPVLFVGERVHVKMGLHIQSMSHFELSTMDYDVDTWLRMGWFDPRLKHSLSRPILINEYTFLKKIWRPDPIFTNSKSSTFHKVTYLNFYMLIFPSGAVFMEIRVYLKPTAAQIVLCKYPHDSPAASLKISSLGFTQEVVAFEWFSNLDDAIRLNNEMQIPELVLVDYTPDVCDGWRKSGNYSCLEARFKMRRDIGYHIANTYVPTTICVVFSWISPWLPEEFVEGRIFVSLTVFLTLSAENNSAKEELPKVSYVKAIDIWFGFTSTFVFVTMLQALTVISLEHQSKKLVFLFATYDECSALPSFIAILQRAKAEINLDQYSKLQMTKSYLLSRYYHKTARNVDTFCKVMYPVTFILFLIIYGFVITQGDERKCLQQN